MTDFDSPWKEALDLYFEAFLLLVLPMVHAEIDWSRGYEMLDKELQQVAPQSEEGRRFVDKLAKVWLKSGEEEWILIHVEVQTQEQNDFPERMFVYHFRLRERYHKDVVSLAVLADDRPDWKPNAYHYESRKLCRLSFDYPVVKLLDFETQELAESKNPFAVVVLAHLEAMRTRKQPEDRRHHKTRMVKHLFHSGMQAKDVRNLFRLIDWFMVLPDPLAKLFWHEIKTYQKEQQMPFITSAERIERAEGRAEGWAEGKTEGRAEGKAEGKAEGLREAIILILQSDFGQEASRVIDEIGRMNDLDLLRRILVASRTKGTLEEIRTLWI